MTIGHVVLGLAVGKAFGKGALRARPAAVFVALAVLPDLDAIAFRFGIPYANQFGHRGASHSLVVACMVALLAWPVARAMKLSEWRVCGAVLAAVASHGLLDALTDGGLGPALLWPISSERFFFPWRPIPVGPIGVRFLTHRGLLVASWEVLALAPLLVWALWPSRGGRWCREAGWLTHSHSWIGERSSGRGRRMARASRASHSASGCR